MNLLDKYKFLKEAANSTLYDSGAGYKARVVKSSDGVHRVKFFKNDKHLTYGDYDASSEKDAHEFAKDEMEYRKKEHKKKEVELAERILEPQGHLETADRISDDSKEGNGPIKKMMGNRTPLAIISKILANKE